MTMLKPPNEHARHGVLQDTTEAADTLGHPYTLGVCRHRCSPLYYRAPVAIAWAGTDRPSSRVCPQCGLTLKRTSRHTWAGFVRVL